MALHEIAAPEARTTIAADDSKGFLAASWSGTTPPEPTLQAALAAAGARAPAYRQCGTLTTATWGLPGLSAGEPLVLSRLARRRRRNLGPDDVRGLLARPEAG